MKSWIKTVSLACALALGLAACATAGDGQSAMPDRPEQPYTYTR